MATSPEPSVTSDRPEPPLLLPEPAEEPVVAELVEPPLLEAIAEEPPANRLTRAWRQLQRIVRAITSGLEWLFGAATLTVGLAVLAALPVLQLLSLGYLLEAGGRVARSGRLRDGFIGVRLAARLGGIVVGSWLLLLPVRFLAGLARSAQVIDPGGPVARAWRLGLLLLIAATALHIAAACARGGRLRYFAWPFNVFWLARRVFRGGYYAQARDAVWDTVLSLSLPYYFSLGFRGFVGALAWLFMPVTLLALGHAPGIGPLLGFAGAVALAVVLLYLPFLQMRLAEYNRLREGFNVRAVRAAFQRAPWAFSLAFLVTLLSALPLYLLKIEIMPREAAWLPSLVFIAFIFPARLLTGWALGRANQRATPRHWVWRWVGWLPLLPAAGFYVLVVFFTQFTSWNGIFSLYEQHAFLLPVPFFGL